MDNIVSLVLHSKAKLAGVPFDENLLKNRLFQYVQSVKFSVGFDGIIQASNFREWFQLLDSLKVSRVSLLCQPSDIMRLGFVGGMHWAPILNLPDIHLIMHTRQEFDDAPKKWDYHFGLFSIEPKDIVTPASLRDAREGLAASLKSMIAVALEMQSLGDTDMPNLIERFEAGIASFDAVPPPEDTVHHLAPPGYLSLDQLQTLRAVFDSWPFGGMGWWTDRSPFDPAVAARSTECAEELYRAYCGCLMAVCA